MMSNEPGETRVAVLFDGEWLCLLQFLNVLAERNLLLFGDYVETY